MLPSDSSLQTQPPPSHEPDNHDDVNNAQQNNNHKRSVGSWLLKIVLFVFVSLLILFVVLFYLVGTDKGTKFLLDKFGSETGAKLHYGQGNLRDGLWVTNVDLPIGDDLQILVDKAYVKIGWMAIFAKEVHLRDANIHHLKIINKTAPTNEPFSYDTLSLPINLRLDKASVNQVTYEQATQEPIVVSNIAIKHLTWVDTRVKLDSAKLDYEDILSIQNVSGNIDLTGEYPLDLESNITVHALTDAYIAPLNIQANGTLKRTVGQVHSQYNHEDVYGQFTVQPMDNDTPFSAKLQWQKITLPYATEQNIQLKSGILTASGIPSKITLKINSDLTAKDIPSGHYQGYGVIHDNQMTVEQLKADVPQGILRLQGLLDWSDDFMMDVTAKGSDFDLRKAVPKDYADFAPYVPQKLNGNVRYELFTKNASGNFQMNVDLAQQDGEHIFAKITEGKVSAKSKKSAPWYIDANWQNLRRYNTPDVGDIDSPNGSANIIVQDDLLTIHTDSHIQKLNAAPAGDYLVKIQKNNNDIQIRQIHYQGEVGELTGQGHIHLAEGKQPLTWEIDASSSGLNPQAYQKDIAIDHLVGKIVANGKMIDLPSKKNQPQQRHLIDITQADLTARLANDKASSKANQEPAQTVSLVGQGHAQLDMKGSEIDNFLAKFDGDFATTDLPKGKVTLAANGSLDKIHVETLQYQGKAGRMSLTADVDLREGTAWQAQADLNQLDTKYLLPDHPAVITGQLKTKGKWLDSSKKSSQSVQQSHAQGYLSDFQVDFAGSLSSPQLPSGQLLVSASGNQNTIDIDKFVHVSGQSRINATGKVDLNHGIDWVLDTRMKDFNLAHFVKDMPSQMTGIIKTNGHWSQDKQVIRLTDLNIDGTLKQQPLSAQGQLEADLRLPKDVSDYLQKASHQKASDAYQKVNALIRHLTADEFAVRWGDNYLTLDGALSAQNHHDLTTDNRLQAKVNLTNLDQLSPNISGEMTGGVILVQPSSQALPTLFVDLVASGVRLPNMTLAEGSVQGKIVDLANQPSQLVIQAKNLQFADQGFNHIEAVFNGTEQQHNVHLDVDENKLKASVVLKGGFDRSKQQWQGVIGDGQLQSGQSTLKQLQPTQVVANVDGSTIKVAAHCWQANQKDSRLCLKDNLILTKQQGKVNLVIQNLDTALFSAFMPNDLTWQAKLSGKAIVNWQKGQTPTINATLFSDNGKIGMVQDDNSNQVVTLPYQRISVIAVSVAKGVKFRTDINTGRGGRGYAEMVVDPYQEKKSIAGALVLNELDLAVLKPFFPGMRTLEGNITMAGGLGGYLSQPLFYGDVKLENGKVSMLGLPVNLSNINATAKVRGTQAELTGQFNSGDGQAELTGMIDWKNEPQAKFSIIGNDLLITQPPLLVAKINPDIDMIVKPQQRYVNIEGAVTIPTATLRPSEASKNVVTQSDDVVVLDRRLIGNINEVLAVSKPWSINADIGVDLGDDVKFKGFGATLPLAGAVNVTQRGQGVMQAKGVVQVSRRTNVDAFGQSLELNYAQVRFNGVLDNPNLSIEAIKEIEGKTVGVRVKGDLLDPNIVVFNNAGLTQQQAMNALVTGRLNNSSGTQISEQGFKSEVTNNLAAAGLSLGLSGTRNFTNNIGHAFGLQSLTVDATGNQKDTNINVTGYITPDLYIRYGVGVFNAQNSLSVRYQLTRRIYIEATSAAENIVDVVYRWQF